SVEISDQTYIGTGCEILHGVTANRSIILNKTKVEAGAYVSRGLIGSRCAIGPRALIGAEPADLTEANASAPFVVLGSGSRVGAGAILEIGTTVNPKTVIASGRVLSKTTT